MECLEVNQHEKVCLVLILYMYLNVYMRFGCGVRFGGNYQGSNLIKTEMTLRLVVLFSNSFYMFVCADRK